MTDISYAANRPGLRERIVPVLRAIVTFLDSMQAGVAAAKRYEELNRLSDVELEARGMTREQIIRQIHKECF